MTDGAVVRAVDEWDILAAAHVDRVHDLALRMGITQTAEAITAAAGDVIERIASAEGEQASVSAVVGAWFAAVRARGLDADTLPTLPYAGTAPRDPSARFAVLLRDTYDLPLATVAAALRRTVDDAAAVIAAGRLALYAEASGRPAPRPIDHGAGIPSDLATLGRSVDGSAAPHRALAVRRHIAGCPDCTDIVAAQRAARDLLTAAPTGPDDAARAEVLDAAHALAVSLLPPTAEIVAWEDAPDPAPQPAGTGSVSGWLVVGLVLAAIAAGLIVGGLLA